MSNDSLNEPTSPSSFSYRLKTAVQNKNIAISPTVLEREFNLRWRGEPVTVTAVRKWLLGLAIPTLDKLQVLAKLLDVSEEWLRWGVEHKTQEERSAEEASLIQDFKLLTPRDQGIVRSLMGVFILQYAHDIERVNTPPPSDSINSQKWMFERMEEQEKAEPGSVPEAWLAQARHAAGLD